MPRGVVRHRHPAQAVVVMIASLAAGTSLHAQVPEFPDTLLRQGTVMRSERFEGTHTTTMMTAFEGRPGDLAVALRASLISSTSFLGLPSTRDKVDLATHLEHPLVGPIHLFSLVEGTLTNDQQQGLAIPGLNNNAGLFAGVGGGLVDERGNRLAIAVGPAYNRQLNVEDAGGALYIESFGTHADDEFALRLDGRFHLYDIAPRTNTNGYADLQVTRTFEGGEATLLGRYDHVGTDLYLRRSEQDLIDYGGLTYVGLVQRRERRFRIDGQLRYDVDETTTLDFAAGYGEGNVGQSETIEGLPTLPRDPDPFGTDRRELQLSFAAGIATLPLEGGWFGGSLRAEYTTNEQQNSVAPLRAVTDVELARRRASSAQNDFAASQLRLSGRADALLSRRDTVAISGLVGIYRYDTPGAGNDFDRDEQSIQGEILWRRAFSSRLRAQVVAQVFLTHLVYLFGENSSENNRNRIFRFAPAVEFTPSSGFSNRFEGEVTANYTDYDFQSRFQEIRGRSYRELHLHDSMRIDLSRTLRLRLMGDLRLAERGSFSWSAFAESPSERLRTEGLEAELRTRLIRDVAVGFGGRFSRVRTHTVDPRSGLFEPSSDRTSIGPTIRIDIPFSERTIVKMEGWWEHRFEQSELLSTLPWMTMVVEWGW